MYKKQWYCVAAYCRASNFSLNLLGSPYIWCAVTLPFQQVAPGVCLLGTLQNISEPRWPSLGGLGSPSYLTESSQNSPLSPTIHLGVAKWGEGRAPLLLLLTCQLIPALPVPFLLWVFLKCLFAFFFWSQLYNWRPAKSQPPLRLHYSLLFEDVSEVCTASPLSQD